MPSPVTPPAPDADGRDDGAGPDGEGVFVVFNPVSGRGRGRRRMEAYRALLDERLPGWEEAGTTGPGEEADLAQDAAERGFHTVVAVGGDGTWSHVADRLVGMATAGGAPHGGEPRDAVRMGILPAGTGNDFGRSLGLDYADPAAAVRRLAGAVRSGGGRRVDVGRVTTPAVRDDAPDAEPGVRHFLNLVGFGFDIAVIDAAAGARFLKGELLYKVTALTQLFRFPGFQVRVEDGAGFQRTGEHLMLTVSNGRYFGGGFPIAPGATVEDGLLHACLIGDASPPVRALLFNKAERGDHVDSDRVEIRSAPGFRIAFPAPPRFEVDGDVYRATEATVEVEVVPGALEVVG